MSPMILIRDVDNGTTFVNVIHIVHIRQHGNQIEITLSGDEPPLREAFKDDKSAKARLEVILKHFENV